ncbi:MAG TPA: GldG family protein, partial [Planctomycetota bacterium]|nr:GldG family protein [Planctomycetota bacterium]
MVKKIFSLSGLLVALALFIAVNAFAKIALRRSHIDLTERNLYSLSQGTRNILGALEEPQNLRFYYTPEQAPDGSPIPAYAQRVRELLEEYVSESNGKLRMVVIDPKPFTEEEDQAAQAGLRGIPVNEVGDKLYFGLEATNSVDARETIPFFDPSREESLEYDITQILYRLGNPDRPVVGVMSSLPLTGGTPDPRTGRQSQPWTVYSLLSQALEVRNVETTAETIDPEIDVLMLVHPKELSDQTLYAIDQFALAGGRILAFVDPYCFFDPSAQGDPRMGGMGGDHSSHLDRLLEAWGVRLDASKLAGDKDKSQQIDSPGGPIYCPVVLALDQDCMDPNDVAIRELSSLNLLLAGSFDSIEGSGVTVEPLLQTSADGAGTVDATLLQFGQPDFVRLTESFVPDGQRRAVAVRLTGDVKTAFPDGPPPASEPKPEGADASTEAKPEHLAASKVPFHAVLVADADILADPLWTSDRGF